MSAAVATTATAEANCAHVRELLARRQPRFAIALEAAVAFYALTGVPAEDWSVKRVAVTGGGEQ